KPKEFGVTVENLNGEIEKFQGNYTLFRLKNPTSPYKNRLWTLPDKFMLNKEQFQKDFPFEAYNNEDEMSSWEKTSLQNGTIDTEKSNKLAFTELQTGAYFIKIEGKDVFGEPVVYENYFTVFSPKSKNLAVPMTDLFVALKTKCEVGETAQFLVGSSYKDVAVRYEVRQGNKVLEAKELALSDEQKTIEVAVKEEHRGNISLHTYFMRHGRTYEHNQLIQVPFTNKELAISFETFRNKLQPGEKEEWRIKIKGKQGDKVAAEMVAALYDASLDAFAPNSFNFNILSYLGAGNVWDSHGFGQVGGNILNVWQQSSFSPFGRSYDYLHWFDFDLYNFGYRRESAKRSLAGAVMKKGKRDEAEESERFADDVAMSAPPSPSTEMNEVVVIGLSVADKDESNVEKPQSKDQKPKEKADLAAVKARTNFNETAFFEPHLQTDSEGNVVIKFTIPESLTKWKMLGFAHTQDLRYGFAQNTLVTQKDLMVVPNAPRFFRENDEIVFTTKITNVSDKDLTGEAKLELTDYLTPAPSPFGEGNKANSVGVGTPPLQMERGQGVRSFTVKAKQSTVVEWSFKVPEAMQTLTYKIVAAAGTFSDGEEMTLPVLTNRMLVTETLPLPVRAKQTKTFELKKLLNLTPNPSPFGEGNKANSVGVGTPPFQME
ncbi:MAG: alpha-2-macroglobulin family protein, partial [Thermoflexibacteraceae bacterium]